ncbi:hypothetical protein KFL_000420150 [Klebsormidium nitens]|uniref:SMP-30/Gluconolactonase/LRE-like region domain-containing protein n=1 Tax=Klebsormidium nitens TaxID=105231 RepID=A0A1Y1HPF9_KLENI|nr:hypothetical protein KFL_000420150 [Klebsormidium nitens]|eukprot:GAQ79943.1 hypothetical protein KFL_000420150 [Klebsormidium nitens]
MAAFSVSKFSVSAFVVLITLSSIHATAAKKGPVKRIWYKAPDLYPEGVSYEAKHDQFLVSSLRTPCITAVKEDGSFNTFVCDPEFEGKLVLGVRVDEPRNRVVAAVSSMSPDEIYAAVVGYDLDTADRVLFTRLDEVTPEPLGDPEDSDYLKPPAVANDVAIDAKGNLYVTNTLGNSIWKVGTDGAASVLTADPLFSSLPNVYQVPDLGAVGLNGIEYHPKGFLLVGHTSAGALFKVTFSLFSTAVTVSVVNLDETIPGVDGIVLRPDGKLVAASVFGIHLVESNDNWASAKLVETVSLKSSEPATAITLKDGLVYANLGQVHKLRAGKSNKWFELRLIEFQSDAKSKPKSKPTAARAAKKGAKSTQSAVPVVLISGGLLALLALALAKDKKGAKHH